MKRSYKNLYILWSAIVLILVCGCTAVPIAKDNVAKGIETGNIGFNPSDMGTVKSGRDTATSISLVGGLTGIVAIVCLTAVALAAVRNNGKTRRV